MRAVSLLVIVLALFSSLTGCEREQAYPKPLRPVRVAPVERYAADHGIRYSASVEPYSQVNLAFKVNGYILKILQKDGADGRMRDVQEGDLAKKNTTLAWVDESDYRQKVQEAKAQLAAQEASLKKARLDYARAESLYGTQSLTKPDYDSAVEELGVAIAQVNGAKAQLKQAEINLGYCQLKVPTDSVILSRNIEVGTLVTPGTVAFVLADIASVKAVFGVPGRMLDTIELGAPLTVRTDSVPNRDFKGRVTAVSPAANSQSRVFEVEITIPNPDDILKPGMIASLRVNEPSTSESVLVTPLNAIVQSASDPSRYALFVVEKVGDEQVARNREVKLGDVYGNMIAVTEGVKAGDPVIVSGATMVVDGENVRVIP